MNGVLADAISPEGALLVGACFLVVPFTVVVCIEAGILWRACRMPFARALGWSLLSNVVSAIAGVPILWYFAAQFDAWVPSDLNLYFRAFFWFSLLRYVTYFAASVLVEYGIDCSLNHRVIERIPPRRLSVRITGRTFLPTNGDRQTIQRIL